MAKHGSGGLDGIQGKTLYRIMSAACGAAFMLYGWDAGKSTAFHCVYSLLTELAGVLGGIQETKQFRNAIGNPEGAFVRFFGSEATKKERADG